MALRFIDSMAHYNGTGIAEKWTSNSFANYISSGGRRNSAYLDGVLTIGKTLTHQPRYFEGAAIILHTAGAGGRHLTFTNNGVQMAAVGVENDGTVSIFSGGSRMANSSRSVADYTSWHYYELDAMVTGGTGVVSLTATVRVDGLVFVAYSGTTPISGSQLIDGSASINQCGINASTPSLGVMDFYCTDTATTDQYGNSTTNTGFLGDVEIDAIFPVSDVTTAWSTFGGDGTHAYTCVNDNPPDFDTSYVFTSNTATTSEGFKYQPITGFVGTILGAQYLTLARKDNEGVRIINMTVGTNTTTTIEFQGTSNYLSDYYVYYIAPLDSNFGVAWSTASFGTGGVTFGFDCIG
jgi:hypothetical protein